MFKNRTVCKVLNKSYNESSRVLTINVQIPEHAETTDYFIEELEREHDSAFIAPIGQADEDNRAYVSDFVNLHNPYNLFPSFQIEEPLMIVLANKKVKWREEGFEEGFERVL